MGIVAGSSVNNLGYIAYNGFTFSGPRFRWQVSVRPEFSKDGRTTIANITTLTVRYHLSDGFNIDPNVSSNNVDTGYNHAQSVHEYGRRNVQWLRSMLMKSGSRLTISGMGFDVDINPGTQASVASNLNLFDVRWGPKPIRCDIVPIGDGVFWQVDWVCEFALPECVASTGLGHDGYLSLNGSYGASYIGFPYNLLSGAEDNLETLTYGVDWTIDHAGLTVRAIRGEYSVAVHRKSTAYVNGSRTDIPFTADEIREMIAPIVPDEFQRVSQRYQMSEDKRTMTFEIIDRELASENGMPPGVVDMQMSHAVSMEGLGLPGNRDIVCTMSGSVEVMKGVPKGFVFDRCLLIIQQRIDIARTAVDGDDNTATAVFLVSIGVVEELYGPRKISFTVTYVIKQGVDGIPFANLINTTGLFREVDLPSVTYDQWQKSLRNTAWHQRGVSRMEFQANEDKIVGPCEGPGGANRTALTLPPYVTNGGGSLTSSCPGDSTSYIGWSSDIKITAKNNTIVNRPMRLPGETSSTYKPKSDEDATLTPVVRVSNSTTRKAQTLAAETEVIVTVTGQAARLGKYPEIPKISEERFASDAFRAANKITPIGTDNISRSRKGRLGPCAIYTTKWKLQYSVLVNSQAELEDLIGALEDATILTVDDPEGKKVGGEGNKPVTGSIDEDPDQLDNQLQP